MPSKTKAQDKVDPAQVEAITNQLSEALEERVAQARAALSEAAREARADVRNAKDSGLGLVRENPTAAILGAVGAGILMGMVLSGRRK